MPNISFSLAINYDAQTLGYNYITTGVICMNSGYHHCSKLKHCKYVSLSRYGLVNYNIPCTQTSNALHLRLFPPEKTGAIQCNALKYFERWWPVCPAYLSFASQSHCKCCIFETIHTYSIKFYNILCQWYQWQHVAKCLEKKNIEIILLFPN